MTIVHQLTITNLFIEGYEEVIEIVCRQTGLHAIIVIHNTTLGPALGGVRFYPYTSFDAALLDALRLAKGMTYKAAIAGVGLGGGKSVILAKPGMPKTKELLHSFAEAVNSLKGRYICAENMGTTVQDLTIIAEKTPYVVGTDHPKSSGDPAPFTAFGLLCGIQAVSQCLWKTRSLKGRKIAIQGLGSAGMHLAHLLFWAGCQLIVSDIDEKKTLAAKRLWEATIVPSQEIFEQKCDIFSPCAVGGILNPASIAKLQTQAVAGCANNQLWEESDAEILWHKGILYAPDFVINAGGLINVASELDENPYSPLASRDKVEGIYESLIHIFTQSAEFNLAPEKVAVELAQKYLSHGVGKRLKTIHLH